MTINKNRAISSDEQYTIESYRDSPLIHAGCGIILVKDLDHRFVASNMVFSRFSGVHPSRLAGLNDLDMPWAERSDIYIGHEDAILSGENYNVLEPLPGVIKATLYTSKQIIFDKMGRPAGTTATAIVLNGTIDFSNIAGTSKLMKVIPYQSIDLTVKEAKILFFLLKGLKRNQIANTVAMSLPNYDYHLRRIKSKFGTDSTVKLLEICIQRGYHEIFPFQIAI